MSASAAPAASCDLCRRRPGLSGYARRTADGFEMLPCRCVTDKLVTDLYGHPRNKLALLREL